MVVFEPHLKEQNLKHFTYGRYFVYFRLLILNKMNSNN
jgi:hypothetical protein